MSSSKTRYGPYPSGEGHLFWVDVYADGARKSVWVHREVMEEHLGRQLSPTEIVHHKDENKTNNAVDNLEITTQVAHGAHHAVRAPAILVCIRCSIEFQRRANYERHNRKQGKVGPFCGRSCAGKWSREQQLLR